MFVTKGDNCYFLSELAGEAVVRGPGGREVWVSVWLGNGTGWLERNGVLVIILTHRVLVSARGWPNRTGRRVSPARGACSPGTVVGTQIESRCPEVTWAGEVYGEAGGQAFRSGADRREQTCTPVGGSLRRIREQWNFKCRKECSWQLTVLPTVPSGLAAERSVSQRDVHVFGEPSTLLLASGLRPTL